MHCFFDVVKEHICEHSSNGEHDWDGIYAFCESKNLNMSRGIENYCTIDTLIDIQKIRIVFNNTEPFDAEWLVERCTGEAEAASV